MGAKLVGGLFCHYSYREDIGKGRHDYHKNVKSERPAHQDLIDAFAAITVHMPVIMEDIGPDEIEDINSDVSNFQGTEKFKALLPKFSLFEIEVERDDNSDDPKVIAASLTGSKILSLGPLDVTTPMVLFAASYHYALELEHGINGILREVLAYRGGKQAPERVAPDLFGGEPEDQEPIVPEKAKRGRKKKDGVKVSVEFNGESHEVDMDKLEAAAGKYVPAADDEFHKPIGSFHQDPADVED